MFDTEEFIIAVYLCVDAHLSQLLELYPPRQRGFAPSLNDSEVLTMKVVGEFFGHHGDTELWKYFHRHWLGWFLLLPRRTTFVRQAANLWRYKPLIQARLVAELRGAQTPLYRIDGLPMPVCSFR